MPKLYVSSHVCVTGHIIKDPVSPFEKSRASCPSGRFPQFHSSTQNKLWLYVLSLKMAFDADTARQALKSPLKQLKTVNKLSKHNSFLKFLIQGYINWLNTIFRVRNLYSPCHILGWGRQTACHPPWWPLMAAAETNSTYTIRGRNQQC